VQAVHDEELVALEKSPAAHADDTPSAQ